MKVVILHGEIPANAPADELDALVEAAAIEDELHALGHATSRLPLSLDLAGAGRELHRLGPDVVFNIVETVAGQGRLIHLCPAWLDALARPYTGARTEAVFLTSNKLWAKRVLAGAGIPTPEFFTPRDLQRPDPLPAAEYIVKSVWEHASIGLDDTSIVATDDRARLLTECRQRAGGLGGEAFAERYIEGREFNLGLLCRDDGLPEVLPPAEILFVGYPDDRRRIVGYKAKWHDQSFEYQNTPRRFAFPASDAGLLRNLSAIARTCWDVFELRGYARVDFRVDDRGEPWVLEVNVNPCLSPDAGFAAALREARIPYRDAIARILADGMRR